MNHFYLRKKLSKSRKIEHVQIVNEQIVHKQNNPLSFDFDKIILWRKLNYSLEDKIQQHIIPYSLDFFDLSHPFPYC